MDNLFKICNEWLDNADLDIKFLLNNDNSSINLIFYVVGTGKKVNFICNQTVKFSIDQEPGDFPMYMVLDTSITLKKKEELLNLVHPDMHQNMIEELWHINVMEGDARINIICENLKWEVKDITAEELKWYSN